MIIDFVGSHSTGKTTAQEIVRGYLEGIKKDVVIVRSVSRTKLKEERLWLYDKTDSFAQAWMSLANWSDILTAARDHEFVLCTDLGIRSYAYSAASALVSEETLRYHLQMIRFFERDLPWAIKRFYCPVEFNVVPDGVRKPDKSYQKIVDEAVVKILQSGLICNEYFILTGDRDTRKRYLKLTMQKIMRNRRKGN